MNDKGIVTSGQLFVLFFISRIIISVFCSPKISGVNTLWDYFLPVIISLFLSMLMLVPVLVMYRQNRQMSVSEYSYRYFGKAGNIITILYALYFFVGCVYSLSVYYGFLKFISPDGIQISLILILLVIACVYASFKGLEAVSRLSGIVLVIIIIASVILISFLSSELSNRNYFPLYYATPTSTADTVIFILSRMSNIAVLAMLYPVTKGNITKGAVICNIFVFLVFISMILFLTGSLGEYPDGQPFPIYQSIDGSGKLQRFNPMFLGVSGAGIFCEISMLLYVISQCIKNVSSEKTGRKFTVIGGILSAAISLCISDSDTILNLLFNKYLCFAVTLIFAFVIPLIIVIVNSVKKRKRKSRKFKKVFRVFSLIIAVSVSALMFSGCGAIQLNQRIIVQGIGIDENENNCKLTVIILDTESEEQENAVRLLYSTGDTVSEAVTSLEVQHGRKVLLNQCLFIMMNETSARNTVETLSYFTDNNDIIKSLNLMVSKNTAEQTITTAINDMNYKSEDINLLSDSSAINQTTVQFSLFDYISSEKNPYSAMIFPYVKINDSLSALQSDGSCVVNENKLSILTSDETTGALIAKNEAQNYTSSVTDAKGTKTVYKIKRTSSEISPQIKNENLTLNFDIKVSLSENYSSAKKQLIYEDLYKTIQSGIYKTVTENACDVFSINKYICLEFPEFYSKINNWTDILKNAEIIINLELQ